MADKGSSFFLPFITVFFLSLILGSSLLYFAYYRPKFLSAQIVSSRETGIQKKDTAKHHNRPLSITEGFSKQSIGQTPSATISNPTDPTEKKQPTITIHESQFRNTASPSNVKKSHQAYNNDTGSSNPLVNIFKSKKAKAESSQRISQNHSLNRAATNTKK